MKPDYKNWMPKGMVLGTLAGTAVSLILFIIFGCSGIFSGKLKTVLFIIFLIATVICACVTLWMAQMYRAFSYNGRRKMSKQIIEGIAEYVKIPDGGKGLDVGCGSGALTIICAKRNPPVLHSSVLTVGAKNTRPSINRCVKATLKRKA